MLFSFPRIKPRFKQILWGGLFALAFYLFPLASYALTVQEVPNPQQVSGGWVTDMAQLLSPQTTTQINQLITQLEATNGTEIAVVTVPSTAPAPSVKAFATELFNTWQIGKQGQDNGVLFLVSLGDRRVEIETGYGVEGILPDGRVGRILDIHVIPRFRQDDYEGGILAGTQALVRALEQETYNPITSPMVDQPTAVKTLGFGGILVAIASAVASYFKLKQPLYLEPLGRSRIQADSGVSWLLYLIGAGLVFTVGLAFWAIVWGQVGIFGFLVVGAIALAAAFALRSGLFTLLRGKTSELQPVYCQRCQVPMVQVTENPSEYLSSGDRVAQQLGSETFTVWRCPQCEKTPNGVHIRSWRRLSRYETCPQCDALTLERQTQTLKHPTQWSSGTREITLKCHHCDYHKIAQERIPPLPPPSSGGGGSSGGSSSSGGSFGGGSSGGGGAGRSW
ncbi:MAG: TPM domain-containing protein [Desertifilum sp. SIO1I2]|nr:TPM domain-containing protein [Desertifilum sp. SIO1I2]